MSEEKKERQLVLFDGEPVPESRAKALAKVEKQHGKDAALQRQETFVKGEKMRKIITEKTDGDPGKAIMSRQRGVNRAAGIKSISDCSPEKWPVVSIGYQLVESSYRHGKDKNHRKEIIKDSMTWLENMRKELEQRLDVGREDQEKKAA